MAKTRFDVDSLVRAYLHRLEPELDVERVFFLGELYDGIDGDLSDVRFIVVSRTFEGVDHLTRAEKLGSLGRSVSSTIQAWAFTPEEVAQHLSGDRYDLFLAQYLGGSREVYTKPGITPLKKLRKIAGGKR